MTRPALSAVLGVVVLVLSTCIGVELAKGPPASAQGSRPSGQYAAVTEAARKETLAFLTVDYRRLDPLVARVLRGATGTFKRQYAKAQGNLKATARRERSVSGGVVRQVGIAKINGSAATVLVAADSSVRNRSTKGRSVTRYYRMQLAMQKVGNQWLLSDLQFVG
ncbi:MAG: hypothetical protein M3130_04690 [Actinomycetota bacterium]|nr:hypothetical protein [Actinomycetota bacterium]